MKKNPNDVIANAILRRRYCLRLRLASFALTWQPWVVKCMLDAGGESHRDCEPTSSSRHLLLDLDVRDTVARCPSNTHRTILSGWSNILPTILLLSVYICMYVHLIKSKRIRSKVGLFTRNIYLMIFWCGCCKMCEQQFQHPICSVPAHARIYRYTYPYLTSPDCSMIADSQMFRYILNFFPGRILFYFLCSFIVHSYIHGMKFNIFCTIWGKSFRSVVFEGV